MAGIISIYAIFVQIYILMVTEMLSMITFLSIPKFQKARSSIQSYVNSS